jgi:flagellar hook-basal body complex protein FliE
MSIPAIEPTGFTPFVAPTVSPAATASTAESAAGSIGATAPVGAKAGADFSTMLSTGIERLERLHDRADRLAVQAATGDLQQIHDYTITATEAAVSTQLTTAVRNKALEAFQEIMRISI